MNDFGEGGKGTMAGGARVAQLSPEQRRVLDGLLDVTARIDYEIQETERHLVYLRQTQAYQRRNNGRLVRLWCPLDTLGDLGPEVA